jgi:hypothetical protein
MVDMLDSNLEIEWTTTSMSPTQHVPNMGYFMHSILFYFEIERFNQRKIK